MRKLTCISVPGRRLLSSIVRTGIGPDLVAVGDHVKVAGNPSQAFVVYHCRAPVAR